MALTIFEADGLLSSRNSFWDTTQVKNSFYYPMKESLSDAVIWWRIPAAEEIRMAIPDGWHSYLSGTMTLNQAIEYMNNIMNRVLADTPPPAGVKNALYQVVQDRKR